MIGNAGQARVHVAAAEILGAHFLAGGGLHERRAAEKDRPLVTNDDRLVAHRGHVRAARGARAHHDRDLRDARGRQVRLVEEDPAEVVSIGEHIVLIRQVRAARIDEVHARQPVLGRDLLRAHVLLHRDRIVGAALDRRVVADDHALAAGDPADAGDEARARRIVVVHPVRGELRQLEERRARIEQLRDPIARQQLAARQMLVARGLTAAEREPVDFLAQVGNERLERRGVRAEFVGTRVQLGFDDRHRVGSAREVRPFPRTARGRSASGGSRSCRRRSRRASRHARDGRPDTR